MRVRKVLLAPRKFKTNELRPPRLRLTIVMMPDVRSLPYGKFFGTDRSFREIPGFSLTVMTPVLRPEDVPMHTHEEASFVLILDGAYLSSADGAGAECRRSTAIYNPPRTTHRDRFKTLDGCFLAISVSRESFRQAAECASFPAAAQTYRRGPVVATASRLARECGRCYQDSALLMEGACLELLGQVAIQSTGRRGKSAAWIHSAKELMRDRCADHLRLIDIARSIGVHPVHLARGFRQFLGCTPGEYLMRCRMERAVTILRSTNLPLADTALQAGFFDQSHLTRAFRLHFGLSPNAYRRIIRPHYKAARGCDPC